LVSRTWAPATATIGACTARLVRTPGSNSSHVQRTCAVTWSDQAGQHTSTVDVGSTQFSPGSTVALRVHGNDAALDTPQWIAWAAIGLGAVLAGTGAVLFVRATSP